MNFLFRKVSRLLEVVTILIVGLLLSLMIISSSTSLVEALLLITTYVLLEFIVIVIVSSVLTNSVSSSIPLVKVTLEIVIILSVRLLIIELGIMRLTGISVLVVLLIFEVIVVGITTNGECHRLSSWEREHGHDIFRIRESHLVIKQVIEELRRDRECVGR